MKKYIGDVKVWENLKAIIKAVKDKNLEYKIEEGEAAFYGPV